LARGKRGLPEIQNTNKTMIAIEPRSIQIGATPIGRGLRVTLQSTGVVALTGIGSRGDYILLSDGEANGAAVGLCLNSGEKAPAVASEATNIGDLAYSAANGQVSKTAAGAVLVGRWTQAASGAGVLGEIELETAA
jgi:hypothetical protein